MRYPVLLVFHAALLVSATAKPTGGDWRLDLLKEEGLDASKESLQQSLSKFGSSPEGLKEAYLNLGADEFKRREEAQKKLLRGGAEALDWLESKEPSPSPEVRQRVAEIRKQLISPKSSSRERAFQHAVRSLLSERDRNAPDTGGLFYESFGEDCKSLEKNYRKFSFESSAKRGGAVRDGMVVLPGEDGIDGDQRLVLHAEDWPGREDFGKSFRVSAKTGGTPGSAGAWHLGIAIGKVRVLYHPDLRGGGFRFEVVDKVPYLTRNEDMGFTPKSNTTQWMSIDVHRLGNGKVKLDVTIEEGAAGPGRFQRSLTVDAAVIGDLNRLSLERSGREGGTALFDEVTVDLRLP